MPAVRQARFRVLGRVVGLTVIHKPASRIRSSIGGHSVGPNALPLSARSSHDRRVAATGVEEPSILPALRPPHPSGWLLYA